VDGKIEPSTSVNQIQTQRNNKKQQQAAAMLAIEGCLMREQHTQTLHARLQQLRRLRPVVAMEVIDRPIPE
jgi:hypothetical protein